MIIKVEKEINVRELIDMDFVEDCIYNMVTDNLSIEDYDILEKLDKTGEVVIEAYAIIADELIKSVKKEKGL